MLDYAEVSDIAYGSVRRTLGELNVVRVFSGPMTDAEGHDALRVTIVIPSDALDRIDDDALVQTLVSINKRLRQAGEDRQSVVFYASEEELATSDDPES